MTRQYREYTDDDVIRYSREVKSLSGLLKKCNIKNAGGNYANMKRILQRLEIDTSHWTGQSWSKGEQFKNWKEYNKARYLKPHLIKMRGHRCELCKNEEWMNFSINLEVHHVDGDKTNNEYENLQLLCPNCHSTTDTWRNRKRGH